MRNTVAYIIIALSYALGAGSLFMFMIFLYAGPMNLVDLGLKEHQILLFDAGISFLFFAQHSLMIRQSFRRFMERFIPESYSNAIYSVSSGMVLAVVLFLWQSSEIKIAAAEGILRIILEAIFFLCMAGFFWVFRTLKHIDAFGVTRIRTDLRGRKSMEMPFVVAGAYRVVRHPLYFLSLLSIWVYPDLFADRLVFNILWTIWIITGTLLEERDLKREFGEKYLNYQHEVPMLIPYKISSKIRRDNTFGEK
jgi:protein-S-isoprenylcysteine O-methyltransferase Ste14